MLPPAPSRDEQRRQHRHVHQREKHRGERHQHGSEQHVVVIQRHDGTPQRGGVPVAAAVHLGNRKDVRDDVDDEARHHQRQQHRQPLALVAVQLHAAARAVRLFIERNDFVAMQGVAMLASDPGIRIAGQRLRDRGGLGVEGIARCAP
ncbi:hypothetical protein COLO4_01808 [Corchorus olitorius]|uniref:Uncharacterized protein n=1 Tax=Corchorus olitorius TaxID=93759 RepID=A0A1R3L205_9ROSI|nr:hypothetical protein COLO4_01808 [Corchorus olitorius]